MEQIKRIKIVMICHFSNEEIRSKLTLDNRKLYSFFRKILGLPKKATEYIDIASWDSNIIENLRSRNEIELYVISAHSGIKKMVSSFSINTVKYYFVKCDYSTVLKRIIPFPHLWHAFNPIRPIIRRIVDKISPDLVFLMGAENAYYSGSIIGLEKKYPVLLKCQTIYNNPKRKDYGYFDKTNAYVERKIFEKIHYCAISDTSYYHIFRQYNIKSEIVDWEIPFIFPTIDEKPLIQFDLVNYAVGMSRKKGFHDSIEALARVKKYYPNVSLNLVGNCSDEVREELEALIQKHQLASNVIFTPFFKEQKDMLVHIQKSRYALLPCKLDYISGTTIQAMNYGLPVICYATEGTPTINKDKQCVLIAKLDDVEDLSQKMLDILSSNQDADELKHNAKDWINTHYNNQHNTNNLISIFRAIIKNYYDGLPIPESLKFTPYTR